MCMQRLQQSNFFNCTCFFCLLIWQCCAGNRVSGMRPDRLAALLRDKDKVAERLVQLRQLLPDIDVSALVARQPDLLAQASTLPTLLPAPGKQ